MSVSSDSDVKMQKDLKDPSEGAAKPTAMARGFPGRFFEVVYHISKNTVSKALEILKRESYKMADTLTVIQADLMSYSSRFGWILTLPGKLIAGSVGFCSKIPVPGQGVYTRGCVHALVILFFVAVFGDSVGACLPYGVYDCVVAPLLEELCRWYIPEITPVIHILEGKQLFAIHAAIACIPTFWGRVLLHAVNNVIAMYTNHVWSNFFGLNLLFVDWMWPVLINGFYCAYVMYHTLTSDEREWGLQELPLVILRSQKCTMLMVAVWSYVAE
jgi:hypothetical protein